MLVFSLIFYSWGGPKYLLLLVSMVFASWIFALLIYQYQDTKWSKIFLISDCVVMLGLLGFFKYLNFLQELPIPFFICQKKYRRSYSPLVFHSTRFSFSLT